MTKNLHTAIDEDSARIIEYISLQDQAIINHATAYAEAMCRRLDAADWEIVNDPESGVTLDDYEPYWMYRQQYIQLVLNRLLGRFASEIQPNLDLEV